MLVTRSVFMAMIPMRRVKTDRCPLPNGSHKHHAQCTHSARRCDKHPDLFTRLLGLLPYALRFSTLVSLGVNMDEDTTLLNGTIPPRRDRTRRQRREAGVELVDHMNTMAEPTQPVTTATQLYCARLYETSVTLYYRDAKRHRRIVYGGSGLLFLVAVVLIILFFSTEVVSTTVGVVIFVVLATCFLLSLNYHQNYCRQKEYVRCMRLVRLSVEDQARYAEALDMANGGHKSVSTAAQIEAMLSKPVRTPTTKC